MLMSALTVPPKAFMKWVLPKCLTAIALSGAATTSQHSKCQAIARIALTITDYHTHNKPLNMPEILVYSSNIDQLDGRGSWCKNPACLHEQTLTRLELEI